MSRFSPKAGAARIVFTLDSGDAIRSHRVRAARMFAGSLALLLAAVSAPANLQAASDDPVGGKAADDLVGQLEGVLDAELAQCDKIKAMSADELEAAKAKLAGRTGAEQDVANLKEAERALEQARAHLKKAQDELADRITKAKLKAKSDIDYREGEIKRILAMSQPLDEEIKKLDTQIADLNKTIAAELARIDKLSWVEQQTAKQPAEEQARVKQLKEDRAAKADELAPLAAEMKPHKEALDLLKADLEAAEEKAKGAMKARIAGAEKEVAKAANDVETVRARITGGGGDKAVAAQLSRPGLLECIAAREDVLIREGLGTAGTSATTGTVTVSGAEQPDPPHAPGSQPFSSAGLEGKTWPGTWEVTCKQGGQPDEHKKGVGEFRFTGDKASILLKQLFAEDPSQADKPIDMPLDELGAFAVDIKEEYLEWALSGQFQIAAAADGTARPTGRGNHKLVLDLSFLSGMMTAFATLGADSGVEMSPEEREKATSRCNGTWELP
jgi:hypothetical protein